MKKIFCFLFLYIIAILAAIAQHDPQFSFNRLTKLTVNPGYAGSDGLISGIILNRYQWIGVKGSPRTLVFSADGATNLFGLNSGVGLNVISDELGFYKNISVRFDYAYRKKIKFGNLGIGASLGFYNMGITATSGDWYIPESDYHQTTSDAGIPQGVANQLVLDLGLGLYLNSNDYFIGASVTHLNQASISYLSETAQDYLARIYYLSAGYNISLSDPLFELQPSVYFRTDMVTDQADFTVDLVYNKRLSAGLNYRINDAVCVLFGFEMNNGLKIGYAYDIGTSALSTSSSGSMEFYLSYNIDLGKNRSKRYKSIRYL